MHWTTYLWLSRRRKVSRHHSVRYLTAVVRLKLSKLMLHLHLVFVSHVWYPYLAQHTNLLESVQKCITNITRYQSSTILWSSCFPGYGFIDAQISGNWKDRNSQLSTTFQTSTLGTSFHFKHQTNEAILKKSKSIADLMNFENIDLATIIWDMRLKPFKEIIPNRQAIVKYGRKECLLLTYITDSSM